MSNEKRLTADPYEDEIHNYCRAEIMILRKERDELRSAIRNLEFAVYNFDRVGDGLLWCCEFCEVRSKPLQIGYTPDMEELPHAESCLWKRCRTEEA